MAASDPARPPVPEPVEALREMAYWLERALSDGFRVRAYRRAADALAQLTDEELDLLDERDAWTSVPGLGEKIAAFVREARQGRVPEPLARLRDAGSTPLADDAGLRAALRGDLHVHTVWSDGTVSLREMVGTAEQLGHEYIAVTDHSPRLRVAHGLSPERVRAQWGEIEEVQGGTPVRILRGGEIDILETGALDQSAEVLDGMDVVVASIHSDLRADRETMTRRMVAGIANPHTTVLGHCTGRLVRGDRGVRPESAFDAEVVFEACRTFGVAVEINSRPERLDPPMRLLRLAADMGCLFSIDTDAHAPGQLDFLSYGCERAAAAGIAADRIITTWPLDDLLAFAAR